MRTLLVLALVAPALAGCLSGGHVEVANGEAPFVLDFPVHVVAVGFEDFDEAALEKHLVQSSPIFNVKRAEITALVELEPLQYNVQYKVREAPDEFATALFAFAESISEKGQPDEYLAQYDREHEQRVCPTSDLPALPPSPLAPPVRVPMPPCEDIDRIDANAIEQWLFENRAAYGVEFGGASHTFFVLDSYSKGHLPRDTYHQYSIGADVRQAHTTDNLRAWGGNHDFVFLDVGAAPNAWDDQPWVDFVRDPEGGLMGEADWPIWEYADDMDTFYKNLGRNVGDAVSILWANDPLFRFEYAERYVLPTYVIIDPHAQANPNSPLQGIDTVDVQAHTLEEDIRQTFRDLAPWAEIEMPFTYTVLPDDDPALAAAVEDAKQRYSRESVDFGVLKQFFREHWGEYVPDVPGARVYPTFAFWFGEPSIGAGAFANYDEWGDSWGVFFNIADNFRPCVRADVPMCSIIEQAGEEVWWRFWNFAFVHEMGHSFGLSHVHDSGTLAKDGSPNRHFNWLWDSTASAMTYRHTLLPFSANNKQLVLRNHAVSFALDVLTMGDDAPGNARDLAKRALQLISTGQDWSAFEAGREAKRAAGQELGPQALDLVAGTPLTVVVEFEATSRPAGRLPAAAPFGGPPDPLSLSFQQVDVKVPTDADAVLFEFRERDAPSHAFWSAGLEIYEADGDWVTGAYYNAYDAVVLRNMTRCASGCTVWMYADSGVAMSYDVTVTPFHAAGGT